MLFSGGNTKHRTGTHRTARNTAQDLKKHRKGPRAQDLQNDHIRPQRTSLVIMSVTNITDANRRVQYTHSLIYLLTHTALNAY